MTSGFVMLHIAGDRDILVYPKPDHTPASFTVLNFPVDDIEAAVDALTERGVSFEHYPGTEIETDEKGIFRGAGPLHRMVHRPGRQRALGDPGPLSAEAAGSSAGGAGCGGRGRRARERRQLLLVGPHRRQLLGPPLLPDHEPHRERGDHEQDRRHHVDLDRDPALRGAEDVEREGDRRARS